MQRKALVRYLNPLIVLAIVLILILLPGCSLNLHCCTVQYFSATHYRFPDGSIRSEPGKNGRPVWFKGSGFIWRGRYVVTSEHALKGKRQNVVLSKNFLVRQRAKGEVIRQARGVALIRLDVREELPSLPLAEEEMVPGEPVTILDGSVSPAIEREAKALFRDSVKLESPLENLSDGISGSPVINRRREVVGIVLGTLKGGEEETVLVHSVSEIKECLRLDEVEP